MHTALARYTCCMLVADERVGAKGKGKGKREVCFACCACSWQVPIVQQLFVLMCKQVNGSHHVSTLQASSDADTGGLCGCVTM